jgi:flagellar hook-associated protein 2
MSLSPLVFSGVSQFSDDFQKILERTVQIASLPLQTLQTQQSDLVQRKAAASSLQGAMTALTTSFKTLVDVGDRRAISTANSDPSTVRVVSTTADAAATYTISEITSTASAASETSVNGFAADATNISATRSFRLVVGSNTYNFTLEESENTLAGLRDKINGLGAGVSATIFTTGTGATPNYLSVSSNSTGAKSLTLTEDPDGSATAFLTASNQGSNAAFKLNGVAVERPSNVINDVINGVSFEILKKTEGTNNVVLTLRPDATEISTALESFVSAYNSLVQTLDTQIGEDAGLLTGSALVREIQDALRSVKLFTGTGAVQSLAELGLEFDNQGVMSFNSATLNAMNSTTLDAALSFLSSETDGLGSLVSRFTALSDPVTGLIESEISGYDETERRLTTQITDMTDRINRMQTSVAERLQAADALLAQLESQQAVIDSSLQSLALTLYGKSDA